MNEGAQGLASTIEETSAATEELSASVDIVSEHAQSQAAAVVHGPGPRIDRGSFEKPRCGQRACRPRVVCS